MGWDRKIYFDRLPKTYWWWLFLCFFFCQRVLDNNPDHLENAWKGFHDWEVEKQTSRRVQSDYQETSDCRLLNGDDWWCRRKAATFELRQDLKRCFQSHDKFHPLRPVPVVKLKCRLEAQRCWTREETSGTSFDFCLRSRLLDARNLWCILSSPILYRYSVSRP